MIVRLNALFKSNAGVWGSKAANLGEATNYVNVKVPQGYVISADATPEEISYWCSTVIPKLRIWDAIAIRSSGLAEDGDTSSYAGQHLTVLNLSPYEPDKIYDAIIACRESGNDAKTYRKAKGEIEQGIAVIIQHQIPCSFSGVLFTANPINGSYSEQILEWTYGLGNKLVGGEVNPEGSFTIKNGNHSEGVWLEPFKVVVEAGQMLTRHFKKPLDIEWGWHDDKFVLFQVRPITTMAPIGRNPLEGNAVCKGITSGKITWGDDQPHLFEKGNILCAKMTTPDMIDMMIESSGIATIIGGRTCHAAIIARELGKPCVVGIDNLFMLEQGEYIEVNGDEGYVKLTDEPKTSSKKGSKSKTSKKNDGNSDS